MSDWISYQRYNYICTVCRKEYTAQKKDNDMFCGRQCQNKFFNAKAKRISLKLTNDQREVILALQDYFLR